MQTTQISHKDAGTLDQIYQHPASHNLEWRDVVTLIEHLGSVEEKGNGRHVTFTVNGLTQGFHCPPGKEISEVQQILDLRHFLENSGYHKSGIIDHASSLHLLVVINQKETLIFRTEGSGSTPERLEPYDPRGNLPFLKHTDGADRDARSPENLTYYKAIAETLTDADEVLLMGNGTAASSAMAHLQDFLVTHHPEIAAKIVGAMKVDIESLTEGEMLQKARAYFARRSNAEQAAS